MKYLLFLILKNGRIVFSGRPFSYFEFKQIIQDVTGISLRGKSFAKYSQLFNLWFIRYLFPQKTLTVGFHVIHTRKSCRTEQTETTLIYNVHLTPSSSEPLLPRTLARCLYICKMYDMLPVDIRIQITSHFRFPFCLPGELELVLYLLFYQVKLIFCLSVSGKYRDYAINNLQGFIFHQVKRLLVPGTSQFANEALLSSRN